MESVITPFEETMEFLKGGHKFEARWRQRNFLGVKDYTTEKIVGHVSGVFTVQSSRRRSADDRYDVETLMSVTWVPCDPQATKLDEVYHSLCAGGKPKKTLRRLCITKRDLDKYGYTAGCAACDATRTGNKSNGVQHTPSCRERMERLLQSEEGKLRVAQHTAKTDAEITGQREEVSEEGTKILYGHTSERPQGVPQEFKVFARLDKQARCWDKVFWRATREFKTGNIIKSEPIWILV